MRNLLKPKTISLGPNIRTCFNSVDCTPIFQYQELSFINGLPFHGSDHCHALVVYSLILDHFKCCWVLNDVTLVDEDPICQPLIQQKGSTLGSVVSLAMLCDGRMQKL